MSIHNYVPPDSSVGNAHASRYEAKHRTAATGDNRTFNARAKEMPLFGPSAQTFTNFGGLPANRNFHDLKLPYCRLYGSNHRTISSLVATWSAVRTRTALWGYGCIRQAAAGVPGLPVLVN